VRTPVTPDRGLYHSKRLLAFAAPPGGLFPAAPLVESWADALQKGYVDESTTAGVTSYANATARTLVIKGDVNLAAGKPYHIDDIRFSGTLKLASGQLQLVRVEAKKVQVDTFSTDRPVLTAAGCLFESLSVGAGPAQLDSCTVLDIATLVEVQAVDCIFMAWAATNPDLRGTFHHCRIPADDLPQADIQQCTRDDPKLFATAVNFDTAHNEPEYNGAGVLRPDSPATVYAGASDGGELGYFHGGRQDRPVRIEKPKSFTFVLPAAGGYPLEDVLFGGEITVSAGRLRLRRSAAKRVSIETGVLSDGGEFIPSLDAVDCLFEALDYPGNSKKGGLVRLEYCTVLGDAMCWHLQASDCIFAGDITGLEKVKNPSKGSPPPAVNCVRYSAVRYSILDNDTKTSLNLKEGRTNTNTWLAPLFQVFEFCLPQGGSEVRPAQFGEAGCGVLGLQTAAAIRFGAEDGGEMGAGHHLLYSLKAKAVLTKMQEFLPLGIEPVLIYDPRLLHLPPRSV
ncbi:MAG TPA: hypothetical protein VNI58_01900, partial [Mariprofundaceae bacterium]|nr:hypothetical protein [Mariprofundaceae bacterium]